MPLPGLWLAPRHQGLQMELAAPQELHVRETDSVSLTVCWPRAPGGVTGTERSWRESPGSPSRPPWAEGTQSQRAPSQAVLGLAWSTWQRAGVCLGGHWGGGGGAVGRGLQAWLGPEQGHRMLPASPINKGS